MEHPFVFIHFAPKAMHQDINHIGLRVKAVIEDVFQNHGFGHGSIGMTHHVFEQRELPGLQFDGFFATTHLAGEQVHREITHSQTGRFGGLGRATDECLNPRQQLGKRERLGQVIVTAGLQTSHAVIDGGFGAED